MSHLLYRWLTIHSIFANSLWSQRFRWAVLSGFLILSVIVRWGGIIAGLFVLNILLYQLFCRWFWSQKGFQSYYAKPITRQFVQWLFRHNPEVIRLLKGKARFYEIHVAFSRTGREQVHDAIKLCKNPEAFLGADFVLIANTWAALPKQITKYLDVYRIESDTRLAGISVAKRKWNTYVLTAREVSNGG